MQTFDSLSKWCGADSCGCAVLDVDLKPLDCWDHGFESRCGNGCCFLWFIVCRAGSGLCDELITHSEESYWLCVSFTVCVI
jgi:hypothetical protein